MKHFLFKKGEAMNLSVVMECIRAIHASSRHNESENIKSVGIYSYPCCSLIPFFQLKQKMTIGKIKEKLFITLLPCRIVGCRYICYKTFSENSWSCQRFSNFFFVKNIPFYAYVSFGVDSIFHNIINNTEMNVPG